MAGIKQGVLGVHLSHLPRLLRQRFPPGSDDYSDTFFPVPRRRFVIVCEFIAETLINLKTVFVFVQVTFEFLKNVKDGLEPSAEVDWVSAARKLLVKRSFTLKLTVQGWPRICRQIDQMLRERRRCGARRCWRR
jgi:hypothetical protein